MTNNKTTFLQQPGHECDDAGDQQQTAVPRPQHGLHQVSVLGSIIYNVIFTTRKPKKLLFCLDLSTSSIPPPCSPDCLEQVLSGCSMLRNLALEMCSLTDTACRAIAGQLEILRAS